MPRYFDKYVTPTMKEVFTQSAKDDKEGFQNDAGLTMEPRQLAARTVWWENFMARHPHHVYFGWAKSNYNMLLYVMVSGMSNTPVTVVAIDPWPARPPASPPEPPPNR